ncbi:MAG: tetratricopeptide repeat protein [Alphaproteobacteria bacterium]|nr:tetratricopeptide repeat protein [Alphaproteobacteria bacterium]
MADNNNEQKTREDWFAGPSLGAADDSDLDAAIEACTEAIKTDSENADAYYTRGVCYVEQGKRKVQAPLCSRVMMFAAERMKDRCELAIKDFTRVIEINPDYPDAHYSRGVAYMLKGDPDRAIADYDRAIELNPDNGLVRLNRGRAYFMRGENMRAVEDYGEITGTIAPPPPRETSRPRSRRSFWSELRRRKSETGLAE